MDFALFAATGWTIDTFLTNLNNSMTTWGKLLVTTFGTAMVIAAVYHIAKGLMSQGKGQTNWVMVLLLLFVGGAMMATTGWSLIVSMSEGFRQSVNDLGGGFILPFWIN